jgi:DNA-binding SARP family transcriptional activator/tetratricopeptide (TPR) repeat protein
MGHLALSLMGPFRATLYGQPARGLSSDRLRGLLAYLAVMGAREHSREQVAALLWPERTDEEALKALRFAVSKLRSALDDRRSLVPFILVTRTTVQFNPASDHWLDVVEFESLAETREVSSLERAAALYRGPFLEGLSPGDSSAFEDWLLLKVEAYRQAMLYVLADLTTLHTAQGAYTEAVRWARRQLEIEPYREHAHRQLMTALALDGDRPTALMAYEACRRLLLNELGCEPEDKTQALCSQIRQGTLSTSHFPPAVLQAPAAVSFDRTLPAASPPHPWIVAREPERARLTTLLAGAQTGSGTIVLVTGEAGSGKTALLDAWACQAEQVNRDLIVLRGSCNTHGGAGDPYLPFREILQTLAGDVEGKRAGGTLSQQQVQRVWESLPLVGTALMSHGPDLVESFVPGRALLQRAEGFPIPGEDGRWKVQLRELVSRVEAQQGMESHRRLPARPSGSHESPDPQAYLFAQATQVLHAVSQARPLLLLIDDLQWADSGTAALLFHLGRRLGGSRILVVCACRPEALDVEEVSESLAQAPHATTACVGTVLRELCRGRGDVMIDLDKVDGRAFVEAYLDVVPNQLDAGFRQALYQHTGGNPLFTVELLRSFERDGTLVKDSAGRWVKSGPLNWERWPPQVEAVVAGHMAGLAKDERVLLEAASVQGGSFIAEVVARVLDWPEEEVISRLSGSLRVRHRLVEAVSLDRLGVSGQRLSTYRFRHVLLQMGAYGSLDTIQRAMLHEATARAIEAIYGAEREPLRGIAPELARHFEIAAMPLEAARYRLQAGQWAARLVAHDEALAHLQRGLVLLEQVGPSPERQHLELELWVAMVSPAVLQGGWCAPAFTRALTHLARLSHDPALAEDPLRLVARMMLVLADTWRSDTESGKRGAEQLLRLAHDGNRQLRMPAHWTLGNSAWSRGDLPAAREHLSRAVELYDPEASLLLSPILGSDPGVMARSLLAYVMFQQGYADAGQAEMQRALEEAEGIGHVPTKAFAHVVAGIMALVLARDADAARRHAAAIKPLGNVAQFYGRFVNVLAGQGSVRDVPPVVRETGTGEMGMLSIGVEVGQAAVLMLRARMLMQSAYPEAALKLLDRALDWIEQTGVRVTEAEVWRTRGELLLSLVPAPAVEDGERCLKRSVEVARAQGAHLFELRAATSLARLWQTQERPDEARNMLSPIYDWFTEGFDGVDLQEAKALLDKLAPKRFVQAWHPQEQPAVAE